MENTPKRDLKSGVALDDLPDGGIVLGNVETEEVILVRRGEEFFAVGAQCTHYHGPLAEGLVVNDTIRCPWHHACFSLRTGEAVRAPALSALATWEVEREQNRIFVRRKRDEAKSRQRAKTAPDRIVIVGGGAAGFAAAETLRRQGFAGDLTMLSDDSAAPVDRPNLSKDYLAGSAPEDWVPLRPDSFYA